MELATIGTIVSGIAAILAWVAKILWSKEYRDATDRTISSKDAEIANLKSHIERLEKLSPMIVEEYYATSTKQMESILSSVQEQLDIANSELSSQKDAIEEYKSKEESYQDEIAKQSELIRTKEERMNTLQKDYGDLKELMNTISHEREKEAKLFYEYNPNYIFQRISASSTDLGEVMANDGSLEVREQIDRITLQGYGYSSVNKNDLLHFDVEDGKEK